MLILSIIKDVDVQGCNDFSGLCTKHAHAHAGLSTKHAQNKEC